MFRSAATILSMIALSVASFAANPQQSDKDQKNQHLDISSSVGDLHIGDDGDARKAGLALYPGARVKHEKDNSDAFHMGVLTEAFGIKLVVAKYESDDAPGKVIDFYRDQLKKYGKVLECHTASHGGDVKTDINDDDDKDDKSANSKALKCDGDNSGPVTELKVGTEENQHVVAIEPVDAGKRSTFALVYVHTRGKQGDI
jgi:hypothetical protein